MHAFSRHILRIGLGITFLSIGIMILRAPEAWGGYILPWAARLLPVSINEAMQATAILDIAIGAALILNLWTWFAALIGALHIVIVLITSGITDITVRDIGLFAAAIALTLDLL